MPRVSSDGSARPLYVNVAFRQEEIGRRRRAARGGSVRASRAHTYNYFLLSFEGWMFFGVNGTGNIASVARFIPSADFLFILNNNGLFLPPVDLPHVLISKVACDRLPPLYVSNQLKTRGCQLYSSALNLNPV